MNEQLMAKLAGSRLDMRDDVDDIGDDDDHGDDDEAEECER